MCRSGLRGFDAAYCFGAYEKTLQKLIHLFKYAKYQPLGRPLGALLASALPADAQFDAVVAVPMHWRRRFERGFNQAEVLGREAARRRGLPFLSVLKRRRSRESQASLTHAGRRANAAASFALRRSANIRGKRILLVDDVMTTGSTAHACGLALRRAGAASVVLLTLARVDRRPTGAADQ